MVIKVTGSMLGVALVVYGLSYAAAPAVTPAVAPAATPTALTATPVAAAAPAASAPANSAAIVTQMQGFFDAVQTTGAFATAVSQCQGMSMTGMAFPVVANGMTCNNNNDLIYAAGWQKVQVYVQTQVKAVIAANTKDLKAIVYTVWAAVKGVPNIQQVVVNAIEGCITSYIGLSLGAGNTYNDQPSFDAALKKLLI